ncbi:ABC transporter permease [Methanoplanus sp. FWC-SCC4]|uniref:ABC transporter permease n=1 Tax=Methanochimaera problematica TaxID=2609417 RepID=A0AA97I3P3_9EURY|nr:ABC transporter permease [Methanoplanus sp. FWC-SCC4]WOF15451.1 ABC transporter permease [Methanoplanus sp. FWC-SCC4]
MIKRDKEKLIRYLLPVVTAIIFLILWQLTAVYIVGDSHRLPSVVEVFDSFLYSIFGEKGSLLLDLEISLYHFIIGMSAAIIVGIPVGIAMGWFKRIDQAINPIVEILRPIPPLAWIPFAIIWFGLTHLSAGFIIFVGALFPVLVNTYSGFKNVPKVFVEAGKVLGCSSSLSQIRYIAFPSAIPSITTGIRISMGVGWMCLVGAEIFGAGTGRNGLGKNLWTYYNLYNIPMVVVYMLVLGLIGLAIDMAFRYYVDRLTLKWQEEEVR